MSADADLRENCTEMLVQRDDGTWWCPKCGHETAKTELLPPRLKLCECKSSSSTKNKRGYYVCNSCHGNVRLIGD